MFDKFKAHIDNLKEEKKREAVDEVVFPCVLKILPKGFFNNKDPISLGVDVLEGIVKVHFSLLFFVFVFLFLFLGSGLSLLHHFSHVQFMRIYVRAIFRF